MGRTGRWSNGFFSTLIEDYGRELKVLRGSVARQMAGAIEECMKRQLTDKIARIEREGQAGR